MIQDVFLVGLGNVGRELVMQMFGKGDMDGKKHQNPSRIVGVTNSKYFMYKPEGLKFDEIRRFYLKDCWRRPLTQENIFNDIKDKKHEQLVFVDATASSEMKGFYEKVINKTPHCIITANKKPLVECDFETFRRLTREMGRFGYRCSVMAGAGGISWIRKNMNLGDPLESILGVLSGTNAFVMSRVMNLERFSASVEEAVRKKYAEPDCADDLNGKDAARKLVTSARTGGIDVEMSGVERQGLVPDEMLIGNYRTVIRRLREKDEMYRKMAEEARKAGSVWTYVAEYKEGRLVVGLRAVDREHPLAQIKNNENTMIVTTKDGFRYDSSPVPGAGLEQTARNIRWDLNDLLPEGRIAY